MIIKSFLDTDFYKFTMGQLIFELFPETRVKYALVVRTPNANLAGAIKETDLRRELDWAINIKPNNSDLHYLRGTNEYGDRMFREDYLASLKNNPIRPYRLCYKGNAIELEFSGCWHEILYLEIFALAIINELYGQTMMGKLSRFEKEVALSNGRIRLYEKIKILRQYPGIFFSDFGTRRRFSLNWQDEIDKTLSEELPHQFLGTSDVFLAMKYGLVPMGTSAHEMFQVGSAIYNYSDDAIRSSQNRIFEMWWQQYGYGLSIFLPDTFGSEFTFKTLPKEWVEKWKGFRQDSGDPFAFGERVIKLYQDFGIDPKSKLLIFSDALTVDKIVKLYLHFKDRIKVSFGWGTNLTNDLGLFQPLSMVIKVVEANGHRVVKLSDNIAKAVGDPNEIEIFKRIFEYPATAINETCVY